MDCFLVQNGGGAPLNFKVVGNPQPASPKENTIWLNTDVPIGKWHFDAIQPDDLQEGDVWFSVGTSSPVAFNALKRNGIAIYPHGARQMIGGSLVSKDAKIYQNGAWTNLWDGVSLYTKGDQCEHITGGWMETYQEHAGTPPIFNSDHILIETDASHVSDLVTKNPVNLTGISKLQIYLEDAEYAAIEGSKMILYISSQNNPAPAGLVARTDFKTDYAELNVTAYNAPYYIAVSAGVSVKCKITDIKWEVA